ncbi:hypothetical protein AVEN_242822-1 [Araneus ventricosus]|uniref:Uncharacterized protein n=1 Tax=Araneus ventricosus TaxID=182803 RepID=A0A4Y2RWF3_ARAVE|nr:hypothetical protein AVEN_242822-1 [Araneus ventricosus]
MLPHRGEGGGPGWNERCTSGIFCPGRVTQGVKAIPLYPAKATDKIRLLPSGVQGLVPTEAALFSFTMNHLPIIFCGRADSWTWSS